MLGHTLPKLLLLLQHPAVLLPVDLHLVLLRTQANQALAPSPAMLLVILGNSFPYYCYTMPLHHASP
jgi:hypothetical protein